MARFIPEGLSVHLIRRGNNRGPIFADDYDRETFLALFETASSRHCAAVHAYVLMTNHYHAVVTPRDGPSFSLMMRDLGREYVSRYNRRHNRIGTLWTGRPRVIPIEDERYWLTCVRYVEQNPVRAGLVSQAADYRWSSYAFHALGKPHEWLTRHHMYQSLGSTDAQRQDNYQALFAETLSDAEIVRQRLSLLRAASGPQSSDNSIAV